MSVLSLDDYAWQNAMTKALKDAQWSATMTTTMQSMTTTHEDNIQWRHTTTYDNADVKA